MFQITGRLCKYILQEWNKHSFYFKPRDISHLVDETQETDKTVEGDVTMLEAGIGDSFNP
jgi:hypothetical protein